MSYNGWKNYETWNVKLWLDNYEGTYHEVRHLVRGADDSDDLAKQLEDWVTEAFIPKLDGMAGDILTAAMGEVDWREIAAAYWEDEHEDDEDEAAEA